MSRSRFAVLLALATCACGARTGLPDGDPVSGAGGGGSSPACVPGEPTTKLADGYVWPFGIAEWGGFIYFTVYDGDGALVRVSKTGGAPRTLIDRLDFPSAVAVDATGVYVAVSGDGQILRTDPNGNTVSVLANGQFGPSDIRIDGDTLYWTNYFGKEIRSMPKSGASTTLLSRTQSSPYRLAVGPDLVYWSELIDGVRAVPKAGGEMRTLTDDDPRSLAVGGGWLYYSAARLGSIRRIPLGGGTLETLYERDGFADGVAVDARSVFATFAQGEVMRLPLGGGEPSFVANTVSGPTHLAVDDSCIYWTATGEGSPRRGAVLRAARPD